MRRGRKNFDRCGQHINVCRYECCRIHISAALLGGFGGGRQRATLEEELAELSTSLSEEREREASLPTLKKKKQAALDAIERAEKDRKAISVQGNEARANELDRVTQALDGLSSRADKLNQKKQAVTRLQDAVIHFRGSAAKKYLAGLQDKNADAALSGAEWEAFEPVFGGDVDSIMTKHLAAAESEIQSLRGVSRLNLW